MNFLNALFRSSNRISSGDIGTSFLWACKAAHFAGIRPANPESYEADQYKHIVDLGKQLIDKHGVTGFSGYFRE